MLHTTHTSTLNLILLLLFFTTTGHRHLSANLWNDFVRTAKKTGSALEGVGKDIKKTAEQVGKAIETTAVKVGSTIADRFKDTQATRAIDYAARKAALESALAISNGVLDLAQKASTGTLATAEKTASLGLTAAEYFLKNIVEKASPVILKSSADAAQQVLSAAKTGGIATLKGTEWVINQSVDVFDINSMRYRGDLRSLEKGILGNVSCEGTIAKKKFSLRVTLDPRKPIETLKPLVTEIVNEINEELFKPLKKNLDVLNKNKKALDDAQVAISLAEPQTVQDGIAAAQNSAEVTQQLADQDKLSEQALIKTAKISFAKLTQTAEEPVNKMADEAAQAFAADISRENPSQRQARFKLMLDFPQDTWLWNSFIKGTEAVKDGQRELTNLFKKLADAPVAKMPNFRSQRARIYFRNAIADKAEKLPAKNREAFFKEALKQLDNTPLWEGLIVGSERNKSGKEHIAKLLKTLTVEQHNTIAQGAR